MLESLFSGFLLPQLIVENANVEEDLGVGGGEFSQFEKGVEGVLIVFRFDGAKIEIGFGFIFVKIGLAAVEGDCLLGVGFGGVDEVSEHLFALAADGGGSGGVKIVELLFNGSGGDGLGQAQFGDKGGLAGVEADRVLQPVKAFFEVLGIFKVFAFGVGQVGAPLADRY